MVETSSGRRYFAWGGQNVVAEYVETGSGTSPEYSKSYIYAGSRLFMTATKASSTTETKEFHHPDRLGTQLVTDGATGTSFRQSTMPFGTAISTETTGNTNQVFTSYDRSSTTGLDYAQNRTYSKGQSRFTQVDPIAMASASLGNPQSNNLYAYVQNMPTDYIDPSGLNISNGRVCYLITNGTIYKRPNGDHWFTIIHSQQVVCVGGANYSNATNSHFGGGGGSGGGSAGGDDDCRTILGTLDVQCLLRKKLEKANRRDDFIKKCIAGKIKDELRELEKERGIELDDTFISALTAGLVGAVMEGGIKVVRFRSPKAIKPNLMTIVGGVFATMAAVLVAGAYEGTIGYYNYQVKLSQASLKVAANAKSECAAEADKKKL